MPEQKEKFSIGYIYLAFAVGFTFGLTLLYFGAGLSCKNSSQPAPNFDQTAERHIAVLQKALDKAICQQEAAKWNFYYEETK